MAKIEYIYPIKIVSCSDTVDGAYNLLNKKVEQLGFDTEDCCTINGKGFIVLDFGMEYQGGIRVLCSKVLNDEFAEDVRIRFGESLSEASSELGYKNSTNNHSLRDIKTQLINMSDMTFGQTGFRFVRIDFLGESVKVIKLLLAAYSHCDKEPLGKFNCNDKLLVDIFNIAKRTIYLNIQNEMIWDGIKRDRLVWAGDMHAEMQALLVLYGCHEELENSLELIMNTTKQGEWINTIPSFTLWWIITLNDYCYQTGNFEFLKNKIPFLQNVLVMLKNSIKDDGSLDLENSGYFSEMYYFIDWPTFGSNEAKQGVLALCYKALLSIKNIFHICKIDVSTVDKLIKKLDTNQFVGKSKPALAIACFAGLLSANDVVDSLLENRTSGFSCFICSYILKAISSAGKTEKAVELLKEYFGGMLQKGATTFWEDFDVSWMVGSCGIDQYPKDFEKDIHADFGRHCYTGLRHSLCHGWSSGILGFFATEIMGIKVLEAGAKTVAINPNLCGLKWAEITLPTSKGLIKVRAEEIDGKMITNYEVPKGVKVIGAI